MISKFVNNICGIAMTLTDHASSVMSSQCLYIGMKAYPLIPKRATYFPSGYVHSRFSATGNCPQNA
jgi:hypothetical protein